MQLARYYDVTKILGKPAKEGRFKVGWKSDFIREYATLFGLLGRLDRISMSKYKGKIIEGNVHVVERSQNHRKIHEDLQYSVVDQLLRVKTS